MAQSLFLNWQDIVRFSPDGPVPRFLFEAPHFRVLVAGLEAGQRLPVHPEAAAMYHVLEGSGWMTVNDERFAIGPGATVVVPDGAARGIEADTRLAFLAARAGPAST